MYILKAWLDSTQFGELLRETLPFKNAFKIVHKQNLLILAVFSAQK